MKVSHILIIAIIGISSCSIAPGMHMDSNSNWINDEEYVYIPSLGKNIKIIKIEDALNPQYIQDYSYKIGNGDQIAVTIWGLPDIFPMPNTNENYNLRRVDSNGEIFFPYVGLIQASGKTQKQLRNDLSESLKQFFNNPQVDIGVAKFNSQQIYVLGEVITPAKLNITDVPISLSDALGESNGLNSNTAEGSEVFIIREKDTDGMPKIYHANLSSPSAFIDSSSFYLKNNDIVYVNSSDTARWNRVISQFFPFSSFLNSVDNLTKD